MAVASRLLLRSFAPSPSPSPIAWTTLLLSTRDSVSSISGRGRGMVTASRPCCKGRKGGSSILRPKPSRGMKSKAPGAGKKKKPKVHGEPFSRKAKDKREEEKAKKQAERLKDFKWDESMPRFEV